MTETADVNASKKENIYRIIIIFQLIIIAVLVWLLISARTRVQTVLIEKKEVTADLQHELDSLLKEHNSIKKEYGTLSEQLKSKDSAIAAQAAEIQKLIASQADYRQVKRKLDYLRGITQGYVRQIDSLFRVNQELREENVKITKKYVAEQNKTKTLAQEKDVLTEKVEIASMLKAYNLNAVGVRKKGREGKEEITDKARRVERIKICFTLSQNLITQGGEKVIYCRITRPDNQVLAKGKGDIYSFMFNGEMIQYSIKKVIDYKNKEMDVCMYWDKADPDIPAMTGKYNVAVFVDGYEIGQTSFEIK